MGQKGKLVALLMTPNCCLFVCTSPIFCFGATKSGSSTVLIRVTIYVVSLSYSLTLVVVESTSAFDMQRSLNDYYIR